MSKHPISINHYPELYTLARQVADLRYDKLSEFLENLMSCISQDSINDFTNKKPKLGSLLMDIAICLEDTVHLIDKAWTLSEPHEEQEPVTEILHHQV